MTKSVLSLAIRRHHPHNHHHTYPYPHPYPHRYPYLYPHPHHSPSHQKSDNILPASSEYSSGDLYTHSDVLRATYNGLPYSYVAPSAYGGQVPSWRGSSPASTRYEIRDLSDEMWGHVVDCLWIMKNTSHTDGQTRYGSKFLTYDYFSVRAESSDVSGAWHELSSP